MNQAKEYDILIVGAGIMGATLATILKQADSKLTIKIIERLEFCAGESSRSTNNSGTGHSGFCELNYDLDKAVRVCEAFEQSKQFWTHLVKKVHFFHLVSSDFIHTVPHISFVDGKEDVKFLRERYNKFKQHPLFSDMEFTDKLSELREWLPLVMKNRGLFESNAATRVKRGCDVNFGNLTVGLMDYLQKTGVDISYDQEVIKLKKNDEICYKTWNITTKSSVTDKEIITKASFVFIGAGGAALTLLQKSGIPEIKGYGGFPVSGQFLICDNPEVVAQHNAKVYGRPEIGAPPMSQPHLDSRFIGGRKVLLFGPYASFSTRFLKNGHWSDFFKSLRFSNIFVILSAGLRNFGLSKYLLSEVTKSHNDRFKDLLKFYPTAKVEDWKLITAGQRGYFLSILKKGMKKKLQI